MKKLSWMLVLAGVMSVPAIAADSPHSIAYNVGATTDYIFRGISQSQGDPAISGGIDYSHASGFYAGAWASTQKWVETGPYKTDSDFELDLYGGYKGTVGDIGYDVGVIRYSYDGDRGAAVTLPTPDTTEVYIGASWKFLSAKYSYVVSDYFVGWGSPTAKSNGSSYLELNATHDLGNGWGLLGHIGHQKVENTSIASYTDFKVGVTKDVGFGVVTLAYSDTDADTTSYTWAGEKVADGAFALSFSKSF
ncbi:MAG: TorF family putative porin [Pseudomonadota bacterium]